MEQLNNLVVTYKKNLLDILPSSTGSQKNYTDYIKKAETLKQDLYDTLVQVNLLVDKSKTLVPLTMRKLKLKYPYNKSKCLIAFKSTQVKDLIKNDN